MSSLDQQTDLVSRHVGAIAWNSAKANVAASNSVGSTTPHVSCCKGSVSLTFDRLLRRGAGASDLASKLISQPPMGWDVPMASGERFWRGLRFGGAGFMLAWLLAQL